MSLDPMPDSAALLALKAERERRLGVGAPTGALTEIIDRGSRTIECSEGDDARLEKQIVADADKQLRALGFIVVNFSQPRATKQTAGIPDRRYYHVGRRICFWWEAKAPGGKQSPAQREFQDWCVMTGDPYCWGTDADLYLWLLVQHPLVRDESGHLTWRSE